MSTWSEQRNCVLGHGGTLDSDTDAVVARDDTPLELKDLLSLVNVIREWRARCPRAQRLNGRHSRSRRRDRQHAYIHFNLTKECLRQSPLDSVGRWKINGDTKVSALDELVDLYEMAKGAKVFDEVFYFDQTKAGTRALRLRGKNRACGFYCYKL
jgi:hypothetical protein